MLADIEPTPRATLPAASETPSGGKAVAPALAPRFVMPLDPAGSVETRFADDALESPAILSRALLWSVAALIAAFVAWAAFASLDIVVSGEGKVIPAGQTQVVQSLDSGVVSEIAVKLGDKVERDQVLMRIDDTRFKASLGESRAKDDALRARIVRLEAEAGGVPFSPPEDLRRSLPTVVAQERALFDARIRELRSSLDVLRQQIDQRRQELQERRAREAQLRQSLTLVTKELDLNRPLLRQGIVSEVDVLRLERQVTDLRGDLDASTLAIPRLEAAIGESEQRLQETAAKFRAEAARELSTARADQAAISAANVANQDRVTRAVVRAPVSGTIKSIKLSTLGSVVQPGSDLFEIVPADDSLVVDARVKPSDIAFLKEGQPATVKLSAWDYSIYGGFPGIVEHISADSLVPDKPNEKPEPFYRVRIRTSGARLDADGRPLQILPGMVATVDIRTGQRTVLDYLLKPIVKTRSAALRER